ncbi:MAG TPA: transglycosylase SLT domain-containing protein [Pyrinomonadaceae bacterium]|nr:transglycosylase SLT domain-containing protein [Pyrinomonadaceae bacterium]
MKRLLVILILLVLVGAGAYFFNQYWIHRFDPLIARQAGIYRIDPDLVWCVVYEETYFRPWKVGNDGEIGLMQITPAVGRMWATETGMRDFERQMAQDPKKFLSDPERNIQIGCWYLEKFYEQFRDMPGAEARMVAGYNAGASRAEEWNRSSDNRQLSADEFITRIDIPSTRAYVSSILNRYRKLKAERAREQQQLQANSNANSAGGGH